VDTHDESSVKMTIQMTNCRSSSNKGDKKKE